MYKYTTYVCTWNWSLISVKKYIYVYKLRNGDCVIYLVYKRMSFVKCRLNIGNAVSVYGCEKLLGLNPQSPNSTIWHSMGPKFACLVFCQEREKRFRVLLALTYFMFMKFPPVEMTFLQRLGIRSFLLSLTFICLHMYVHTLFFSTVKWLALILGSRLVFST
jgi:hypothetical protein